MDSEAFHRGVLALERRSPCDLQAWVRSLYMLSPWEKSILVDQLSKFDHTSEMALMAAAAKQSRREYEMHKCLLGAILIAAVICLAW